MSCRRDETEEKTEKADWAGSCELLSDLGKHGKSLDRGVQDLSWGDPGGCMKTEVHVGVEVGIPEDRSGLRVAAWSGRRASEEADSPVLRVFFTHVEIPPHRQPWMMEFELFAAICAQKGPSGRLVDKWRAEKRTRGIW